MDARIKSAHDEKGVPLPACRVDADPGRGAGGLPATGASFHLMRGLDPRIHAQTGVMESAHDEKGVLPLALDALGREAITAPDSRTSRRADSGLSWRVRPLG